jgi:hypothetical protein
MYKSSKMAHFVLKCNKEDYLFKRNKTVIYTTKFTLLTIAASSTNSAISKLSTVIASY